MMNLFGVFTVRGSILMALFRNKLDAEAFKNLPSEIPLEVAEVNAYDAMKMFGREI